MSGTEAALWIGLATFVATVLGPVLAVEVSRVRDEKREKRRRQVDVFRTLMRGRRTYLSPEFVGALNLIEVEFYDVPDVTMAWKRLLDHFSGPQPKTGEEEVRFGERGDQLRAELLAALAKYLRMEVPHLSIRDGGYSPIAHGHAENESAAIRKLLAEIANGRRALPVIVYPAPPSKASDQSGDLN